jgi:hypothetical protein
VELSVGGVRLQNDADVLRVTAGAVVVVVFNTPCRKGLKRGRSEQAGETVEGKQGVGEEEEREGEVGGEGEVEGEGEAGGVVIVHEEVPHLAFGEYCRRHWVNEEAGYYAVVGKMTGKWSVDMV